MENTQQQAAEVGETKAEMNAKELRQLERQNCEKEIATVLQKYNCALTAQVIVGENRIVPQVFIIDARN
jgi:hypothetical protein